MSVNQTSSIKYKTQQLNDFMVLCDNNTLHMHEDKFAEILLECVHVNYIKILSRKKYQSLSEKLQCN